jgi:hypothetical protein
VTATVEQARDQINTLIKAAMDANAPSTVIVWDDQKAPAALGNSPWVRVSVRHNSGGQSTISRVNGKSRYSRSGTVYVNLFAQPGDGLRTIDPLTKIALDAFEGKTTPGQIWFTKARVRELGVVEGWYQVNVLVNFSYDDIK